MSDPSDSSFEQCREILDRQGLVAALDWLEREMTASGNYAALFDVLQLRARNKIGLQLVPAFAAGEVDRQQQEQFERQTYQSCRHVGQLLFRAGQPRQAWQYFQLVGDRAAAAKCLRQIPRTAASAEELIEVALYSRVDPEYGIELILRFQGTCSGITQMDLHSAQLSPAVRDACASRLVRHLYAELLQNVGVDIRKRKSKHAPTGSLVELIESRPWLFADGGHHVDPSHLVAVLRIGHTTTAAEALDEARMLCVYGMMLDKLLISPQDIPWEDYFPAQQQYFNAARGVDVDAALEYFRGKLVAAGQEAEQRRATAEILLDLLCRNQRWSEALDVSLAHLEGLETPNGIVPGALEIAQRARRLDPLAQWYRQRGNLLMFAVALMSRPMD